MVRPAASVYAVCIAPIAGVSSCGTCKLHGAGPAASTAKMVRSTSAKVKGIALPATGACVGQVTVLAALNKFISLFLYSRLGRIIPWAPAALTAFQRAGK